MMGERAPFFVVGVLIGAVLAVGTCQILIRNQEWGFGLVVPALLLLVIAVPLALIRDME